MISARNSNAGAALRWSIDPSLSTPVSISSAEGEYLTVRMKQSVSLHLSTVAAFSGSR